MSDKNKFQEMLKDILEVARVQGNVLTMEEVKSLFGDMELSDTQYEHIFAYLAAHQIKIQGYVGTISEYSKALESEKNEIEDENNQIQEENNEIEGDQDEFNEVERNNKSNVLKVKHTEKDSIYLKMYLEDLSAIKDSTPKEEEDLIKKIIDGDELAKNRFIEVNLKHVVEIAKEYVNRGLTLEDLIQEGNIGLMTGVEQLSSVTGYDNGKSLMMDYVRQFIELAIEDQNENNSFEKTMIQKTKYLNDAANELAEDLGREANVSELASYTKLTEQEIKDILNMSADVVKVGVSHNHNKR